MAKLSECHDSDSNSRIEAAPNFDVSQLQSQIASLEADMRKGQEVIDAKLESILAMMAAQRIEVPTISRQPVESLAHELTHRPDISCTFQREGSNMRYASTIGQLRRDRRATSIWKTNEGPSGKISRFLEAPDSSTGARLYSTAMTTMIFLCTLVNVFQAQEIYPLGFLLGIRVHHHGLIVNCFFITIFAGELAVRYAVASSRCTFFRSLYNLNDIVVVLASIVCTLTRSYDLDAEMFLHLLPALQFFKLIRRFRMCHLLVDGFGEAFQALPFLIYIFALLVLLFGGIIKIVEDDSNVPNMLTAMWYVLVTISTVGYGDYTAKSAAGKCITSVLILIGILYVAVPVGIVGNAFGQAWANRHASALRSKLKCWFTLAGLSPMDLPIVWGHFDTRNVGSLDFADFQCMLDDLHMHIRRSDARKLFRLLDKKNIGSVSAKDVMKELFPKTYEEVSLGPISEKQSTSASVP